MALRGPDEVGAGVGWVVRGLNVGGGAGCRNRTWGARIGRSMVGGVQFKGKALFVVGSY